METLTEEQARELLRKYRSGECSEAELQILNIWYETLEENNEISLLDEKIDLDDVKSSMFKGINKKIEEESEKKVMSLNFLLQTAAAILIILGTVFIFYKDSNRKVTVNTTAVALNLSTQKIISSNKITLPDGSLVWLKEGSVLNYPKKFQDEKREVSLKGEAFFEVKKDPSKPFIINSGSIRTQVLGTSFNIRAYEEDSKAEVSVVTGKVSVSLTPRNSSELKKEIILQPNQKVTYFKEFEKLVKLKERNALKYKMVALNELVFDEVSMKEIINTINLAYKVKIVLANEKIENCIITADLTNQSLEATLEILTRSIGAKYTNQNNKILISGQGCES